MIKIIIITSISILLSACASINGENNNSNTLELESKSASSEVIVAKTESHKNGYQFGKGWYKAEWHTCTPAKAEKTILLMHDEGEGFDSKAPCQDWRAQSFLSHNYAVILANRPGHGNSTGKKDFVGTQSIQALELVLNKYLKKYKKEKIDGIWGYSFGAVAATLIAKKNSKFNWLLVGGGMYDFDELLTNTKNEKFKVTIGKIKNLSDNALSARSIAYDVEGLPKKVMMYHGRLDQTVPLTEAQVFKETLTAMEIKADLEIFENQNHMISKKHHAIIISKMIKKIKK